MTIAKQLKLPQRFFPALFSLLGVTIFFTCRSKPVLRSVASGKSLLWEITGNGLQQPSYFLGTMHLMCAEDAILSYNVKSLIRSCGVVYLEVDMDNASELLPALLSINKSSGNTLRNTLTHDEYEKVKSFFDKYDNLVPFSVLEKQPPLMITSSLYELLLPCTQKNGVEMKIIDEAYRVKKETKGLETIAFQTAIFDSIPYEDQAKELVKTIDNLEKYRLSIQEMVRVYKEQDIEKLYTLSADEDSLPGNYMDLLLFNRNQNWVTLFPDIAKKSSTLFAVGAGHLGGEKGVLSLLKKAGYNIRPVEN